jgi:hypothetical protein
MIAPFIGVRVFVKKETAPAAFAAVEAVSFDSRWNSLFFACFVSVQEFLGFAGVGFKL